MYICREIKKTYICEEDSPEGSFVKGEIFCMYFNFKGELIEIRFEKDPHLFEIKSLSKLIPYVRELTEDEVMIRDIIL